MSEAEKPREEGTYRCNRCRAVMGWFQKCIYRGVRDCCPACLCNGGYVGTMERVDNLEVLK
jgi:hypothetical protein